MVGDVKTSDKALIAEELNRYFSSIATDLDSDIPRVNSSTTEFIPNNATSMFLAPTTPDELVDLIGGLKNSSSGVNSAPTKLLKYVKHILSGPLSSLINYSFAEGVFPDSFKYATIIPVHKGGSSVIKDNYRPISVLPVMSKIFERAMCNRLGKFFSDHSLLAASQFGFKKHFSTSDALLNFSEFIYNALESGDYALSVFVDFRKAFDTVNVDILLDKLSAYGVRGLCNSWFQSYLTNRKQCVRVDSSVSEYCNVNIGVPQGSVLGPLLFNIYINDMHKLSEQFSYIQFADDTTLLMSGSDIGILINSVNSQLSLFTRWAQINRLSLNISKTKFMIFTNRRAPDDPIELLIGNNRIDKIDHMKFLGVIIDSKLKFNLHIAHIRSKVSKSVGILYKLRSSVPLACLRTLYYCFVYSYLYYCNIVWGGTFKIHIEPLHLLQKRAVRIMNNADYLAHSGPLFYNSCVLNIYDIHKYVLCVYVRSRVGIEVLPSRHIHDTRNRGSLLPSNRMLTLTRRSPNYNGVLVYNALPIHIKSSPTPEDFKGRLKAYLFAKYLP